jgi:signal transduction histidine kinase
MSISESQPDSEANALFAPPRGRLFRKYVALFVAVVCAALIATGLADIWFSFREQQALLVRIQRGQAEAAAIRIAQFVKEIEGHLGWAIQLPYSANFLDEWRFDAVRVMRQVPSITELAQLDSSGRELIRMSRLAMDVVDSQQDFSLDASFVQARENRKYFGPVYFRLESEPYMTLSLAGIRREYGVIVAEVNLKFIWEVVSQINVGRGGRAYLVDEQARLIAHPNIDLVLRNTDMSQLAQVQAVRSSAPEDRVHVAKDIQGRQVLTAYARVEPLDWLVFVEQPVGEAYAPLYASIVRAGIFVLAALVLALVAGLFLARRMMAPIRLLQEGAAQIGGGNLRQRISIKTGDELEALGNQFNHMALQLQESYTTLERKVEERTNELAVANLAKSRFLATASHDLRQPLHALGLFVAQLNARMKANERSQVIDRIHDALANMNELFSQLLDVSKLDSGVLTPNLTEFPIAHLLKRIEATFAESAQRKQLSLRVVPSSRWVRSDVIMLERILINLVSNAVRYTSDGGIVVGCRKRGEHLQIEVWDTGPGIPPDQRKNIFSEFYRLEGDRREPGGLGLGLAIVDRLCRLLGQSIEVNSVVGKGSRFAVSVPLVAAHAEVVTPPAITSAALDIARGKLVVVIDDDQRTLDGMGGLLRSWGCRVVIGASESAVLNNLAAHDKAPDLIISDYQLPEGKTGIDVIEALRSRFRSEIPAFLISGDTNRQPLHEARSNGYHLLHKPVDPMTLRAMLNRMVKRDEIFRVHS